MTSIYVLAIAIGLLLSTCYFLVQSLPIKYHERNSRDRIPPQTRTQNYPLNKVSNQKRLKHENDAEERWAMFPVLADKVQKPIEGQNKIFPIAAKHTTAGPQSSSSASTEKETEMTISIPEYKTDAKGNFLFAWRTWSSDDDEHIKPYKHGNPIKPRAPPAERRSYTIPDSTKYPICFAYSTIYNFPKQLRYLKMRLYHRTFPIRPVWMDLREAIYTDGDSQECHKDNMTDWTKYTQCAIMRNMRMEYLVPKYPLHQHGGYFFPRNSFLDDWV